MRYNGLQMSEVARTLYAQHRDVWDSYCNGVGSKGETYLDYLIYKITPNTIWLLDITPCSDIHDVEYTIPQYFETLKEALKWKEEADLLFNFKKKGS